jgi:hypothetical protein
MGSTEQYAVDAAATTYDKLTVSQYKADPDDKKDSNEKRSGSY